MPYLLPANFVFSLKQTIWNVYINDVNIILKKMKPFLALDSTYCMINLNPSEFRSL